MRRGFLVALVVGVGIGVGAIAQTGCATGESDAPPYDELSLRDALRADPGVIASMPANMRRTLGDRFETDGKATGEEPARIALDPAKLSAREIITAVDAQRESRPADAQSLEIVTLEGSAAVARRPTVANDGGTPDSAPLPPLEGEPANERTNALEARALSGPAAKTLRSLLTESKATHLVRVTGWPVGAAGLGDTVYVNAAWLVARAGDGTAVGGEPGVTPAVVPLLGSTLKPATLRGNPYSTYTTLASCVADVGARCQNCKDSGVCDDDATLDFPDGRTECLFLLDDQARIEQLCVMALTSIGSVSDCVKEEGCTPPTGKATQGSLGAAIPFLQKDACVRALNQCLSGSDDNADAAPDYTTNVIKVDGCIDPISSCSSFVAGCSRACEQDKCNGRSGPSCDSCSGCTHCSGCTVDTRSGSGTGYGSAGANLPPPAQSSSGSDTSTSGSGSSTSGSGSSTSGSGSSTSGSGSSTSGSPSTSSGGSSGTSSGSGGSSGSSTSSSSSSSSSSDGCGGGKSSSGSNGGCGCGGNNGNCNNCQEADRAPVASAFTPIAWLVAPVIFLGKRTRRRRRAEKKGAAQ